jgi:SAM-dependent methyltransferase
MSRASVLAQLDIARVSARPFSLGARPVIRWIKGDGRDDDITRSAIAQATRLFGDRVDYCLCSNGISPARVRSILAWSDQPVEWWPLGPEDNPRLASALMAAGCPADAFGYWWKWFPERVRPGAPECILDGDMIVTGKPGWFDAWCAGTDAVRVSQDDDWDFNDLYGEYRDLIDPKRRLYSGLVSLPPNLSYLPQMLEILRIKPLASGHDGRINMSEQGVVAGAFDALGAEPIPLSEFPFARSIEANLNYGRNGPAANVWGYHFGCAFRLDNEHFRQLAVAGAVYWRNEPPPPIERFNWLKNFGQWGVPGWAMPPACTERVSALGQQYAGRRVLDLGTSRGRLAAILATHGCLVTTVDKTDRSASINLMQMGVQIVISGAAEYLRRVDDQFAMIVADIHDNSPAVWTELWPLLGQHLEPDGAILLSNSHLWRMPEWTEETGLRWITEAAPAGWVTEVFAEPEPGMVICRRAGAPNTVLDSEAAQSSESHWLRANADTLQSSLAERDRESPI